MRMVIGLIGLIALVGIAGTAWFAIGPGAGAPIGSCSTGSTPMPSESAEQPARTISWEPRTVLGPENDLAADEILDVEAFGAGFVAVGRSLNGPATHALVWTSSDGSTWQALPADPRLERTELRRLRVVGARIFAIGTATANDRGGARAAVWFSDDGRHWRPASGSFDETTVAGVAGDGGGLLLLGARTDATAPLAWRSPDGEQWTPVDLRLPVDRAAATFADLAWTEDGWLAVGTVSRGPDADARAVAWESTDGESWTCHVLETGDDVRSRAWELHRGPRGWLVVGDASRGCGFAHSCPGFQAVWAFVDGSWREGRASGGGMEPDRGAPTTWSASYAATDTGFLALGGGAWLSETGQRWTPLDGDHPGSPTAVAVNGTRVASGGFAHGLDGGSDAWLAIGDLER